MAGKNVWGAAALGVVMAVGLAGCEEKKPTEGVTDQADGHTHQKTHHVSHAHEHKAPHGGTLVELGGEFAHVELVLDTEAGKLTGYVLDGEAEKPLRLTSATLKLAVNGKDVELAAVANDLTGEKVGDTSEFAGQADMLKGLKTFDGTVAEITIRGKTFKGVVFKFPEGNDDHAGHKH